MSRENVQRMLAWLNQWDRPDHELHDNFILEPDDDIEKMAQEMMKRCRVSYPAL